MPQINLAASGHGTLIQFAGTADEERYEPYPAKGHALGTIQHAVRIIQNNIYKKNVSCNKRFKTLTKGRSFDEVWSDKSIWINYDPRNAGYFGATSAADTDITVCDFAFKKGVWSVVATIVHELAHTNGAGPAPSMDAEDSLNFCGLGALYDKGAIGVRPRAAQENDERVA
jgi:hypothetical protein